MKIKILILLLFLSIGCNAQLKRFLFQGGGAPPVFEGNGGLVSTATTTLNLTYPGTVNASDILFAHIVTDANYTTSAPSGWTKVFETSGSSFSSAVFYKRATGSEGGSQSFTVSSSGTYTAGVMYRFSGALKSGTPYENTSSPVIASASGIAGDATTVSDNSTLLWFTAVDNDPSTTIDNGSYSRDELSDTGNVVMILFYDERVTAGSGTSWSVSWSGNEWTARSHLDLLTN